MSKKKKRRNPANNAKKAPQKTEVLPKWAKISLCAVAVVVLVGLLMLAIPSKQYAYIEIENYGTIKVELDPSSAPKTVENFVMLAEKGFYDGLTFHRIIEGFMMQGGDPKGNGSGGYEVDGKKQTIVGEFAINGHKNDLSHKRGVISMARSSDPYYNTASSQFFIVHEDSTFLDGKYASFGWVVDGIEIVDAICEGAKPTDNNGTIPASEQPVIKSVRIEKKLFGFGS